MCVSLGEGMQAYECMFVGYTYIYIWVYFGSVCECVYVYVQGYAWVSICLYGWYTCVNGKVYVRCTHLRCFTCLFGDVCMCMCAFWGNIYFHFEHIKYEMILETVMRWSVWRGKLEFETIIDAKIGNYLMKLSH